jgi:hypothetical protein
MKIYSSSYETYLKEEKRAPLHNKLTKIYDKFPNNLRDLPNLILFGPKGVGKYTQMLRSIIKYSPSNLKYDRKLMVTYNKINYIIKISDIHFEIDMSLLGCNSRPLWNEFYINIIDAILAQPNHVGIIVCKYFHEIHSELLEGFYSYMQTIQHSSLSIKFILITEQLSFIPNNIINTCYLIRIPRPSKSLYNKCLHKKIPNDIPLSEINNIKNINSSITQLMSPHKILCNSIIEKLTDIKNINYFLIRDNLYDLLIYNLDITECIWYILTELISKQVIPEEKISLIILPLYRFIQYYNNNYRPIYHLESFIFYLINIINGFS